MVNWLPSHLKDKFITEPKIRKPAANICSNDQSIMESLYLLPPSSMISLGLALSLPHISFSFVLFPQFPLRLSLFYDLGHLVGFLFILGVRLLICWSKYSEHILFNPCVPKIDFSFCPVLLVGTSDLVGEVSVVIAEEGLVETLKREHTGCLKTTCICVLTAHE